MKNDWKIYRIGNRKIYEFHCIDGEEHIYDYDKNCMLTVAEKKAFLYSKEQALQLDVGYIETYESKISVKKN